MKINTFNGDVVREADCSDMIIDDASVNSTMFHRYVIQFQGPRDRVRDCRVQDGVVLVPNNFRWRRASRLTA